MMNDTPLRGRGGDQGAPAEAGRSETIDGGEPTAAGSVVGAASATGCSESVDDATLAFFGGRRASRVKLPENSHARVRFTQSFARRLFTLV